VTAIACIFACVLSTTPGEVQGQPEFPPSVQADLLRNKILDAAKADDLSEVLADIDAYKRLKVDLPPVLLLIEAKAAHKTGDATRAESALAAFMKAADRNSPTYNQAIALYPEYARLADAAKKEDAQRAEQERNQQAAEKARANKIAAAQAEEKRKKQLEEWIPRAINSIDKELIQVDNGMFQMGSLHHSPETQPVHSVGIRKFQVLVGPIRCQHFKPYILFLKKELSAFGCDEANYDGTKVSWSDAVDYVKWLKQTTGRSFRMLSEAEWEYLARKRPTEHMERPRASADIRVELEYETSINGSVYGKGSMELAADCWHDSYAGAPNDSEPWDAEINCGRHVARGNAVVTKIMKISSWHDWNFIIDDEDFASRRTAISADERCCVFRIALDD
jgi:formylglycine-generating enzyme required for sulfatase activity